MIQNTLLERRRETLSQNKEANVALFSLDDRSEASSDFVSLVGRELQKAFTEQQKNHKLSQQALAKLIGVDRSRVHRCLSGYTNLTLESVADLAWAMKYQPHFELIPITDAEAGCNHFIQLPEVSSTHLPSTSTKNANTFIRSAPAPARSASPRVNQQTKMEHTR